MLSLLGLAGTTAALLVGRWLSPVLLTVSLILLGRSFYALYIEQRGTRTSKVIAWLSAASVVGFWMLRLIW